MMQSEVVRSVPAFYTSLMNWDMFDSVISIIGFSTMLGGFLYIGRKLEALDRLEVALEKINNNLKVVADHLVSKDDGRQ